jgi:glutamine amidotransferase
VKVAIVDYGMGNLRSVEKALEHVGASPDRTGEHDRIRDAGQLILPGVGAFRKAMERIHALELDEVIHERVTAGVPLLGLCLGMQLLFDSSTELGGADGLGILPGQVRPLDAHGQKVPQMGWNPVEWKRESRLNDGLPNPSPMYHVHSFAAHPDVDRDVIGTAEYGEEFVTAVEHDNVAGVQFHPEKSGPAGLRLLGNFMKVLA